MWETLTNLFFSFTFPSFLRFCFLFNFNFSLFCLNRMFYLTLNEWTEEKRLNKLKAIIPGIHKLFCFFFILFHSKWRKCSLYRIGAAFFCFFFKIDILRFFLLLCIVNLSCFYMNREWNVLFSLCNPISLQRIWFKRNKCCVEWEVAYTHL